MGERVKLWLFVVATAPRSPYWVPGVPLHDGLGFKIGGGNFAGFMAWCKNPGLLREDESPAG